MRNWNFKLRTKAVFELVEMLSWGKNYNHYLRFCEYIGINPRNREFSINDNKFASFCASDNYDKVMRNLVMLCPKYNSGTKELIKDEATERFNAYWNVV